MPDKNPNLIEEDQLPEDWQEQAIKSAPIIPGETPAAVSAIPSVLPAYFRGSISSNLQHDFYFVGTDKTPRVASTPLMPIAPSGNPQNNAAIQSGIIENKQTSVVSTSGLRFRGLWNSFTAYNIGDIVIDNISSYVAITGSVNLEPDQGNSTNWTLLGKNLNFRGLWAAPVTTFLQNTFASSANGTPTSVTFGSNVAVGSKIVVSTIAQNIGSTAVPSLTDSQGNVYTLLVASGRVDSNEYQTQTWMASIKSAGPLTVFISWIGGTTPGVGYIFAAEIAGLISSPVTGTTSAAQTGTSGPFPAMTLPVSTPGELIYTAVNNGDNSLAAPTGYSSLLSSHNGIAWTTNSSSPTSNVQWNGSFNGSNIRFTATAVSFQAGAMAGFNYNPYDVVEFNGSMWLCVIATNGSPSSAPASWTLFAQSTGLAQIKTTSYLAVSSDEGTLLSFNSSSAVTLTLPATPPDSGWWITVENIGAGALTVSPNGLQIDGSSASIILTQGQGIVLFTDGTNYFSFRGSSSSIGGVSVKTISYLAAAADTGTLLSFNGSNLTLTLPNPAVSTKWVVFVQNLNSTNLTINPNSLNIDGSASNLTLGQNQGIIIFTDGTNYFTEHGVNNLTMPSIFSVSGPDGSGKVSVTLVNEVANTALRGPVSGAPGVPTFRPDVPADLPPLAIATAIATGVTTSQSGTLRPGGVVAPAGVYRVSAYMVLTNNPSAGTLDVNIGWNDGTATRSATNGSNGMPADISTAATNFAQGETTLVADGIHDITWAMTLT